MAEDANTKLLLHCDGTDGSTSFPDAMGNHSPIVAGDAQVDTAQLKFETGSALFDGTGDYISIPDSADFAFGTGDFTVDFWIRFASLSGGENNNNPSLIHQNDGSWRCGIAIYAGKLYMLFSDVTVTDVRGYYEVAWSPSVDTWYHLAFVRADGQSPEGLIFIDGVKQTVTENNAFGSNSTPDAAAPLKIGSENFGLNYSLNGWMDEIRIVKGVAKWTANFTPPTAEYEAPATTTSTTSSSSSTSTTSTSTTSTSTTSTSTTSSSTSTTSSSSSTSTTSSSSTSTTSSSSSTSTTSSSSSTSTTSSSSSSSSSSISTTSSSSSSTSTTSSSSSSSSTSTSTTSSSSSTSSTTIYENEFMIDLHTEERLIGTKDDERMVDINNDRPDLDIRKEE